MFERMTTVDRVRRFTSGLLLCAALLFAISASVVAQSVMVAGARDAPLQYVDKRDADERDVVMVLQLALQSSRQVLQVARRKCDGYAADAARDDVAGVVALANCYKNGVGRPKSLLRAKGHFDVAAAHGSAAAYLALGQFYRDGRIVGRDLRRAAQYFRAAATVGLPQAMVEYGLVLARLYEDRRIVCDWFERAVEVGSRDGMRLLGDCHAKGTGRSQNATFARKLYRRAALLGDRTALLKLSGHVFKGSGAGIASAEGCDWASEAAARDNQAASRAVAYCLSVMR